MIHDECLLCIMQLYENILLSMSTYTILLEHDTIIFDQLIVVIFITIIISSEILNERVPNAVHRRKFQFYCQYVFRSNKFMFTI